jgi:hypothetical protein
MPASGYERAPAGMWASNNRGNGDVWLHRMEAALHCGRFDASAVFANFGGTRATPPTDAGSDHQPLEEGSRSAQGSAFIFPGLVSARAGVQRVGLAGGSGVDALRRAGVARRALDERRPTGQAIRFRALPRPRGGAAGCRSHRPKARCGAAWPLPESCRALLLAGLHPDAPGTANSCDYAELGIIAIMHSTPLCGVAGDE